MLQLVAKQDEKTVFTLSIIFDEHDKNWKEKEQNCLQKLGDWYHSKLNFTIIKSQNLVLNNTLFPLLNEKVMNKDAFLTDNVMYVYYIYNSSYSFLDIRDYLFNNLNDLDANLEDYIC